MLCPLRPAFGAWHPQPPCRKAWRLQLCTRNGGAWSLATAAGLLLLWTLSVPAPPAALVGGSGGAVAGVGCEATPSPPGSHCLVET